MTSPMLVGGAPDVPVAFNPTAVVSLTGHADDSDIAVIVVTRYRRMLPQRVRRIAAALAGDDLDEAMDAVLSLKVSSCTIGAGELFALGCLLEAQLRDQDLEAASAAAADLPDVARRADRALTAYLAG